VTSEVAVLTKQAVALAADSAGTTGGGLKIFNTVNKILALSKSQPVGIMVYSSAEVMGLPVETAIKEFRRIEGAHSHQHLEGYAEAFEDFLKTNTTAFNDEARLNSLAAIISERVIRVVNGAYGILPDRPKWGHPTEAEGKRAFLRSLKGQERAVYAKPIVPTERPVHFRRCISRAIEQSLADDIEQVKRRFSISARTQERIRRLALHCILRDVEPGIETGFVVAGFGTSDMFPRLRAFEFCCSASGCHRVKQRVAFDISDKQTAYVHAFAQANVIMSFVQGMDPGYMPALGRFMANFFREKKRQLRRDNQDTAVVESMGKELGNALARELDSIGRDFYMPLMSVVESMPKEDLALLAEALINLTALRRRASQDAETVGGPTDVAVISKGDGFIWIKRKHYFDLRFNPAFGAIPGGGQ
jgi:hypothetical protein